MAEGHSYLVSDAALVGMDFSIRAARSDLDICRANLADEQEKFVVQGELMDSLEVSLAVERAWRAVGLEVIRSQQQSSLVETIENFGLAGLGYVLGNLTGAR